MIPADRLYRLASSIVGSILLDDDGAGTSIDACRERLADFAFLHALDLEDFATLARVAAGDVDGYPDGLSYLRRR